MKGERPCQYAEIPIGDFFFCKNALPNPYLKLSEIHYFDLKKREIKSAYSIKQKLLKKIEPSKAMSLL